MANLLKWLPTFLQRYKELRELTRAEQVELDNIESSSNQILKNSFISSADESGVVRYEKLMSVVSAPGEALDERKFNLSVKMNDQLPYTLSKLESKLSDLCGSNGYTVNLDYANYELDIKIALAKQSNREAVAEMVNKLIPCNLACSIDIAYNQNSMYKNYTYGELEDNTYSELKNEVI